MRTTLVIIASAAVLAACAAPSKVVEPLPWTVGKATGFGDLPAEGAIRAAAGFTSRAAGKSSQIARLDPEQGAPAAADQASLQVCKSKSGRTGI